MEIKVENNKNEVLQDLENKMPELLMAIGMELYKHIYDFMTEDKVVDTGRLRGSISFSTPYNNYNNVMSANTLNDCIVDAKEKDTIVYGSNVPYANFVETGTTKQRARHFVAIGTDRAVPTIKQTMQKILEKD